MGLCDDPGRLVPGDLFVCSLSFDLETGIVDRHQQARGAGAEGRGALGVWQGVAAARGRKPDASRRSDAATTQCCPWDGVQSAGFEAWRDSSLP